MRGENRRVIGMYRRILAAIDGSPASADTLEQAVRLARELDADLYTISVQEWPRPLEVIGMEVEIPQTLHDEYFDECKYRIQCAAEEAGVRLKSTKVAKGIPGSRVTIMEGMGHFPMIENYPVFRNFLLPELQYMAVD